MHTIFQFPIIDFRPLLKTGNDKLPYPEWPTIGSSDKRFIRRFGAVQQRNAGGSDDWSGEGFFCNSHLAMRYDDLHKQGYPVAPGIQSAIFNSYRRYSSAENFLGRMEAGFIDNTEGLIEKHQPGAGTVSLEGILKHFCDLPVTINDKKVKLPRIGQKLADNYYRESTPVNIELQKKNRVVKAGDVLILIVFSANDAFKLPDYSFLVDEIELPGEIVKLKLHGCRFKHGDIPYKVWLMEVPFAVSDQSKQVKETIRNLRINLLRIHLEKETVRVLLNGIKTKEIMLDAGSPQALLADDYFDQTGQKIFQETRYSIAQKNLLDFALRSEDSADPGSITQLEEGIYNFKNKYVKKNMEQLLTKMAKKMILFICTSPHDTIHTGFDDEFIKIKDALRAGTDRDNYTIEIETSVKKTDLLNKLNRYKPDFLHLCMHTTLKEGLYFEDDDKEVFPMPVEEFTNIIKLFNEKHKPVCIILSACNSKDHAKAVKDYCDFAVGTQRVFPAEAGIVYASGFYQTLFENNSTDIAYCHKNGIQAIQSSKQDFGTYDIPVYDIPLLIN
ncbi:MAG: hypothetical protein ABIN48_12745 [Ginsengibacter sp.]